MLLVMLVRFYVDKKITQFLSEVKLSRYGKIRICYQLNIRFRLYFSTTFGRDK